MANYRPKSLDELNSFYDKTLSSQNEIEANASAIRNEALADEPSISAQVIDDFFAEQTGEPTGVCADLTEDINNFIANFGKPATAEDEIAIRRRPVVPIRIRNAPTPPKPVKFSSEVDEAPSKTNEAAASPAAETQPVAEAPSPQEVKPEKTEFVITAEKNELFEEYMRIMSDEDDDADYSKSKASRKRKKSKKSADIDAPGEISADIPLLAEKPSEAEAADTISSILSDDESDSFVSFTDNTESKPIQQTKEEASSPSSKEYSDYGLTNEEDDSSEAEETKSRKNPFLQLILFLVLFLTLLSAFAVTAVQTTLKVNSGEPFADKYYIYTADFTDEITNINDGDLIVVEKNATTDDNEVFAYNTPDGIAFAVQTFSAEPERTSGKNGTEDKITVMNTAIVGKVKTYYPSLGKIATVITENFMTIIVSLLVFAVFIILLLIFAFRHTPAKSRKASADNFSFDEQEDYDETSGDDLSLT